MKIHRIRKSDGVCDLMRQLRDVWCDFDNDKVMLNFEYDADRDFSCIYLQGRIDQRQYMEEQEKKPAKPLYEWTAEIQPESFKVYFDDNPRNAWGSKGTKITLSFEVFPGDHGGFFARCKDKPELTTEADDLEELKENIINLVRNREE